MTRILVALVVASLSLPANAACVWSDVTTYAVKAVCGDGDEVAPSAATDGLALSSSFFSGAKGLVVTACADAGATITSGTFKAYTYDPGSALWARSPELDLIVAEAGNRCVSWSGMTVTVPKGRAAWIPSVVVLSAGGVTTYHTASP
jgi:hypothetical protein